MFFHAGIQVAIQQIGHGGGSHLEDIRRLGTRLEHGHQVLDVAELCRLKQSTLFEREDDWAGCAWFYLDRPENGLPALAAAAERSAGL